MLSNRVTTNEQEITMEEINKLPEINQVYQIIHTLHHGSSKEEKDKASQYLTQLQTSIYGWKVADDLLIAGIDVESCYYAAQTLRTKLQSSFHELPADSHLSLKDSIMNHLKTINESVIQTQLSLGLTYLAILVPSWTNPIEEIMSKDLPRIVIVEILTVLPEELDQSNRSSLRGVGANRRQQFKQYLASIASQIIKLLIATIEETKQFSAGPQKNQIDKMLSKVYRCLGAWFSIIDRTDINLVEPILSTMFQSLSDVNCPDVVHDAAADTICSAALLCEDYNNYQQLTHYLLNQIYKLGTIYHHSVANEDLDKSINYSRMFTEFAESIVESLIINAASSSSQIPNSQQSAMKLVEMLLDCVGHYDYEVAEITFHFWYRFSELVFKKGDEGVRLFFPIANRLMAGLTKHCQLESDQDGLLTTESDLFDFRLRVRDLVKEMVFIIGAKNYLRENNVVSRMHGSLQSLIMQTISPNDWIVVEAELYILSCLMRDITDDDEIISEIVNIVVSKTFKPGQQQQPMHVQILATSCTIFGELSDWLVKNPTYLDPILHYLFNIITTLPPQSPPVPEKPNTEPSTLSSVAACSLQPIIGSCAETHLVGNWNLISLLIQICSQLDASLNENAAHNLLGCCSTIISSAGESQTRIHQEEVVVQLLAAPLAKMKEVLNEIASGTTGTKDVVIYLDRISAVLRNLKLKPPPEFNLQTPLNACVTNELWPYIRTCLNHFSTANDSRVIERTCRCLRFTIRSLRPSWLLEDVATVVCTLYQQHPKHSSFLYLASILIDEFAGPEDLPGVPEEQQIAIANGLIRMLNAFSLTTFHWLTAQTTQLRNYPDTIDDFFRLCLRYLQKRPDKFLRESMLTEILNLTLASLQIEHREANSSVTKFLLETIATGKDQTSSPEAQAFIMKLLHDENVQIGQRLLDTVIDCALFTLPTYFVPDMADILWAMLQYDRNSTKAWLENSLKTIAAKDKLVIAATPDQLQEFYENVSKANNPKFVAQSLRYLSRLYR